MMIRKEHQGGGYIHVKIRTKMKLKEDEQRKNMITKL